MTDADADANGFSRWPNSPSRVTPDLEESTGQGNAERFGASAAPESGAATSWPGWPGVARPAGWFLPVSEEAAPSGGPGTEPARTDSPSPSSPSPFPSAAAPADSVAETVPPTAASGSGQPTRIDACGSGQPTRVDAYGPEAPTRIDSSGTRLTRQDLGGTDDLAWQDRPHGGSGVKLRYEPRRAVPGAPVVGPTAALQGRAGGPGFDVADGAEIPDGSGDEQSGWQQAHGVWEGSGISWDRPATTLIDGHMPAFTGETEYVPSPGYPPPAPGYAWAPARGYAPAGYPPPGQTAHGGSGAPEAPGSPAARSAGEAVYMSAPVATAYAPPQPRTAPPAAMPSPGALSMTAPPVIAPFMTASPAGAAPAPVPAVGVDASPDYSADPGAMGSRAGRGRIAWHVTRVGLPVAVIVVVGAGAVMMLTGRPGEMLGGKSAGYSPSAHSTSTGSATASGGQGPSGQGTGAKGAGGQGPSGFPGYPGIAGTVTVSSMASAGGTALAVGSADGHPAIWQRSADGSWTLESARQPAVYEVFGNEGLTSITHGPAGWLAVGGAVSGAAAGPTDGTSDGPVVLTSADGTTWHPVSGTPEFSGTGLHTTAVAASGHGYVVVGHQVSGDQTFAALWWSPDLKHWTRIPDGGLAGRPAPSDILGVTAVDGGVVAVGSRENAPAIWVSGTGQTWGQGSFALPDGATSGSLHLIIVRGNTIVTAGNATAAGATIPVVITSADDDHSWRQITLAKPGVSASITSLTVKGSVFTATGASGGKAVTWTSPDGLTWTQTAAG